MGSRKMLEENREQQKNAPDIGEKRCLPLGVKHVSEVLDGVRPDCSPEFSMGLKSVDSVAKLEVGSVTLLASRPGAGKSSLAQNITLNVAAQGGKVLYCTFEDSKERIAQKLLAIVSGIPYSRISNKSWTSRHQMSNTCQWDLLSEADEKLSGFDIFLCDDFRLNTKSLEALIDSVDSTNSPMLVVVDYLQMLDRQSIIWPDLAKTAHALKSLAQTQNIAILGIVQLHRKLPTCGLENRPTPDDLNEIGLKEKDADMIVLLDRSRDEKEAESRHRPDWGTANIAIVKAGEEVPFEVALQFDSETFRFTDCCRYSLDWAGQR